MKPAHLNSLYECRHESQEQWTLWAVAMSKAWPEIYQGLSAPTERFDMHAHLARQREWSERTFGPGARMKGVVDHIRKELTEIEADPADVSEWIDVVILALDGAWRAGFSPEQIVSTIVAKQTKNEQRAWPDWRTQNTDRAIEHDRTYDAAAPGPTPPPAIEVSPKLGEAMETVSDTTAQLATREAVGALCEAEHGLEELRKENFALAAHQCMAPDNDEYGHQECRLRIDSERLRWLHSPASCVLDADGYEWGIYRVKWNEYGRPFSVLATDSNFNDLDAARALLAAPIAPKELS